MPHSPPALRKTMEAALPPQFDWRFRPMFGGIGVYADDRMCVSLSDIGLAVKLLPADQEALLGHKGAKRLQYELSMPPSKTYIVLPDAMLKDSKALGGWLARAATAAAAAPVKKTRKAPTKSTKPRAGRRRD